jgi:hypothetical protein
LALSEDRLAKAEARNRLIGPIGMPCLNSIEEQGEQKEPEKAQVGVKDRKGKGNNGEKPRCHPRRPGRNEAG